MTSKPGRVVTKGLALRCRNCNRERSVFRLMGGTTLLCRACEHTFKSQERLIDRLIQGQKNREATKPTLSRTS